MNALKGTNVTKATIPVGEVFARLLGPSSTVSITAYDGSGTGPADAPVAIEVRSPLALDYLISSPVTSAWPARTSPAPSTSRATSTRRCTRWRPRSTS